MASHGLVFLGGTLNVIGTVLVAADLAFPPAKKAAAVTRDRAGRFVRRVFWWRHRTQTVNAGMAGDSGMAIEGATVIKSVPPHLPLDRKVAFLVDVAVELQQKVGALEAKTEHQMPREWRSEIVSARAELEEVFQAEMRRASEVYLGYRRAGVVLIGFGVILLALADLL